MLFKFLGEDGVELDIMRFYNFGGLLRFLFIIKEEIKDDLEFDDGKLRGDRSRKGLRIRSLSDLIMVIEI